MPTISNKGAQMPESPIRKLVPFAEEAENMGKTVLHLNIGQPDIASPQVALDAIKNIDKLLIEYSHSAGYESYRTKLASYYRSVGIDVSSDEILVTTGGSEALVFGFLGCFNPGDEIIIPEPFYANYNGFANIAGVTIVPVTSKIESGFALPDKADFEAVISQKTKGIVICNPGNPTGYLYSKEELNGLKKLVGRHDLYLFADEVYREFCYDNVKHFSVMNLKGIEQNVVLIDSVSKRYSMCGARIGALISRNKELMSAVLKFAQARLSPPTLAQIASEGALETPQSYFDHVIEEYVERRDILVEGLNAIEGVFCPKPKGAFYCMARFPVDNTEKFCQWLLQSFEHKGKTVMMAPAKGFYATKDLGQKEARIAYVLEKNILIEAIECLKEALEVYPGKLVPRSNISQEHSL